MVKGRKRCRCFSGGLIASILLAVALVAPVAANAAGAPLVGAQWSSAVGSDTAKLSARIDPNGANATYHFEYLTEAAYQSNGANFTGALRAPASGEAALGLSVATASRQLDSLAANTTYRYRAVAQNVNPASPSYGVGQTFTTKGPGPLLPDNRGWEMVSPIDKSGGQVDPPGGISGGGTLQASSDGDAVTYGSTASFAGGLGGPSANQYLARRAPSSWATQNVTAPIAYASKDGGVPYQLFSADLARGLLQNGDHCASGAGRCTVGNAPLEGTDAPPGYQDYYLLDSPSSAFTALVGATEAAHLDLGPGYFDLRFAGASPDLTHVVFSSCAALTPGATEVPQGSGCDPSAQNLYEWSSGEGVILINGATPGAALAAQAGAVSSNGERVYFTRGGDLYLRDGAQTTQVDADAGGGGSLQAASADGSGALFTRSGHLWRYQQGTGHATDLTPSGGVVGLLGADSSANTAYFQDGTGLWRWQSAGGTNQVALGASVADAGDYPPATGTSRVSADGSKLLFVSSASLTGYDNTDLVTDSPDAEVYLYDAGGPTLTCVSCNPTNGRPVGPSTIAGAIANGTAPGSTQAYKPRVLSADGRRVFFNSLDALVLADTNSNHISGAGIQDVYQWEAQGEGGCAKAGGCVALISSGRSAGGAAFVDASADGADAFFITDDSLIAADPGALDLYDARVGGGFPVVSPPIPCEGDDCQVLPSPPIDPTLTTLLSGHGNPAAHYTYYGKRHKALHCKRGTVKRKQRCVKKKHEKRQQKRGGGGG